MLYPIELRVQVAVLRNSNDWLTCALPCVTENFNYRGHKMGKTNGILSDMYTYSDKQVMIFAKVFFNFNLDPEILPPFRGKL